ncbi:MAG: hypothetical protein QM808_09190 [Steroidobacteraceae bacterium]
MNRLAILAVLLFQFLTIHAAEPASFTNNARLSQLFEEDQDDRRGFPNTKLSYKEINVRDEARRNEVLAMLKRVELRTAQDYLYAAVIFNHGQTFEHYRMSTSLAWIAHELEPENTTYAWQTAASWDRMMLRKNRPQWYGVQTRRDEKSNLVLQDLDESAVSDAERAMYNVKPLEELKKSPGSSPITPLP